MACGADKGGVVRHKGATGRRYRIRVPRKVRCGHGATQGTLSTEPGSSFVLAAQYSALTWILISSCRFSSFSRRNSLLRSCGWPPRFASS